MIPQILYLILFLVGIGMAIERHGRPRMDTYNAFTTILAEAVLFTILYYGGFFTPLFEAIK